MKPQEFFYTVKPIFKKVSKSELKQFIYEYPRKLVPDVTGICEPPLVTYNDFELANRWPYSSVAKYHADQDESKRDYKIMENYEEVFASKTGNIAEDGE